MHFSQHIPVTHVPILKPLPCMPLHQRYRQRIKPGTLNSYSCEDTLCATPWAAKFPVKILAKIHFLVIFQTCQECIPTHDCTGNNL